MTPLGRRVLAGSLVVVLAILPAIASDFFVSFVMTRVLMLGIAAASLVFLSAYGGMVSLAQWLVFGVAGFAVGNMVATSGRGLRLGMPPWPSALIALVLSVAVALVLGVVASRTSGIYFLMLTLTFAVIGFFFFGQATTFSGFGGMTGIVPPPFFDGHPIRLYHAALVGSVLAYAGLRGLARSPFGIAMQGVRDDPVRMASLGFDVVMLRTAAFTVAGFVAAAAGILNIWWNRQIDPTSIGIGPTLDLLIIAVIGGMLHLEGAWIGAFIFVAANVYLREIPVLGDLGGFLGERVFARERFNTVIGLILLAIMVGSPDGATGLLSRLRALATRRTALEPGAVASISSNTSADEIQATEAALPEAQRTQASKRTEEST